MKIDSINQTNFKALYMTQRTKDNLSDTQNKIYEDIKDVFNRPFSQDKRKRSYLQYLEETCGKDFFVDNNNSTESLSLYCRYKEQYDSKDVLISEFVPETKLSENWLFAECDREKYLIDYTRWMKKTLYTAAATAVTLLLCSPILKPVIRNAINKPQSGNTTIAIKDSLNKLSQDTLDLTKHFIKK